MRVTCLLLPVVLLSFCVGSLDAATIHVPADQPTIQEGIDAAVDGDTVLVASGTYTGDGNRDIDFSGKAIVVTSTSGPEATIVDAENSARGFLFENGETTESVLDGFTVTNGYVPGYPGGGAILCDTSSPTITNCIITGNYGNQGGGIFTTYSSPTISHCTITDNSAESGGGGIYTTSGSPDINHCVFEGNSVSHVVNNYHGGGLYVGYYGGLGSGPTISHCTFRDNSADGYGGGIYYYNIEPQYTYGFIWDCRFVGNNANSGAGIYFRESKISIYNCLFEHNETNLGGTYRGGGIYLFECDDALIHNCTLVYNYGNQGGGIFAYYSPASIYNCIVFWNSNDEIGFLSDSPSVTYSNIEDGWSGTGNINEDPQFAEEIDFHLTSDSPCIDAGDPSILDGCLPPGLGEERSDMGTYGGSENCEVLEGALDLFIYPTGPTTVSVGDTIFFETLFWNSTGNQVTGDYWLSALLPNQMQILLPEFVLNVSNPLHGSAAAHGSIGFMNEIQALFPGTFQVIARVGVYPNLVFDEESFAVVIVP